LKKILSLAALYTQQQTKLNLPAEKHLAVQCDIRFEEQIQAAVNSGVETFGGIDILVNNASAIFLTPTEHTEAKRFDLMHDINVRGTFLVCKKLHSISSKRPESPHTESVSAIKYGFEMV
jgi:citronellol/citronellal dehydrogenase